MSYHTYSVDGFGFSVDEINTNILRLRRLLNCAPNFNKEMDKYLQECEITKPELDDYLEYDQDYMSGLAFILQEVIEEAEDISLVIADDFDGEWFVMLCPSYPWDRQFPSGCTTGGWFHQASYRHQYRRMPDNRKRAG